MAEELFEGVAKDTPPGQYPMYLVRIMVSWQVYVTVPGGAQDEQVGGTFTLSAYQQVPVREAQGVYQ